ncbi:TIGR03899 family protein [Endozoicomonas sp. G2_1]|uniref:TIGR03899 family protein n=1 Tax=Endozoicomonas sp. G2_1 TaxID=2821091 RepID=UPI001AD9AEA8|nr:TIGR03899 family protein [Endozoicomonas sp. G2_1]MBO9489713.1 TIGR03899 family protein [Endozoicomonas sp. G2_1]
MTKVITTKAEQANAKPNTKSNTGSAHSQLITLAQGFVLDAKLLPGNQQMPIEDRHHKRERVLALRKQQNLEVIVEKALNYCDQENTSHKPDQDWFAHFSSLAENVSNSTMQGLWAKILASELNKPGSFSLKTLRTFRLLSIQDAKLFAKACALAVRDNQKKNWRIITGCYQQANLINFITGNRQQCLDLSQFGLSYTDILTLADNHLLFEQETESGCFAKGQQSHFIYNGQSLTLTTKKNNSILSFYKFTPTGTELAQLINDNPDSDFISYLKKQLNSHFNC